MKKLLFAPLLLVFLMGSGCQNSPDQTLVNENTAYNDTKDRVVNYVTLPRCDATVTTGCADQARVTELKAENVTASDAFKAAWADSSKTNIDAAVADAGVLKKTLDDHSINCRPAAACP